MKKDTKFTRTQADLLAGLHTLRLVTREVGQNYLSGLQADIAKLQQSVQHAQEDDMPDRKQLNQLASMLRWINALDVKPQKGRRRDLKELDRLISKLNDVAETW